MLESSGSWRHLITCPYMCQTTVSASVLLSAADITPTTTSVSPLPLWLGSTETETAGERPFLNMLTLEDSLKILLDYDARNTECLICSIIIFQ